MVEAHCIHERFRIYLGVTTEMIDTETNARDIVYSKEHDAFYNQTTNEWTETKCDDPACEYCTTRPERPVVDK
jgi:hypothetical protein